MDRDYLLSRVSARPLMLAESGVPALTEMLNAEKPAGWFARIRSALSSDDAAPPGRTPFAAAYFDEADRLETDLGFDIVQGVAVLEIEGMLWDRSRYCPRALWTYDGISAAIEAAASDDRVRALMLRIESPGGLVEGMAECAARIRAFSQRAGGGKPIWAVVPGQATSAAYGLASACDRIVAGRGAWVASLASIMVHAEFSKADARYGVTITAIRSRENKARFNAYEALNDAALEDLQEIVDLADAEFVELLTQNRPGLTTATIDQLAGRMAVADPAARLDVVAAGLVDQIATEREAFAALARLAAGEATEPATPALNTGKPAGQSRNEETNTMTRAQMIAALGLSVEAAATLSDAELRSRIRAALAADGGEDDAESAGDDGEDDAESADDDGEDDAESADDGGEDDAESADDDGEDDAESADDDDEEDGAEAAMPDGKTVLAILGAPEAKGREKLARHLAGQPGMTLAAAKAALDAAPKGGKTFAGELPDPDVAANDGGGNSQNSEADKIAARAVAAAGVGAS